MRVKRITKVASRGGSKLPRYVAVDTETNGLGYYRYDRPFMVCVFDPWNKGKELQSFEWIVDPYTRKVAHKFSAILARYLSDESIVKVFHNAKYDISMLSQLGYKIAGRIEDTSFLSRIVSNLEPTYKLKPLAWKFCGIPDTDEKELEDAVAKLRMAARRQGWNVHEALMADYWLTQYAVQLGFPSEWKTLCETYCMMDVVRTARLWEKLEPYLVDRHFRATYEHELELLPIVMGMEKRGLHMWKSIAEEELESMKVKADHHLKVCREIVKKPDFNPGSSLQLSRILYEKKPFEVWPLKLNKATGKKEPNYQAKRGPDRYPVVYGLKPVKFTDTGAPSTDWKALRPYQENPLVRDMMMYKSAFKAQDTFFQKYLDLGMPDLISDEDWADPDSLIIHCSLNQCGTLTGRFSCNDPNLQQVANPESSPRGTDIHARRPFGPRPGYVWIAWDYRQMELRVYAYCAQVPGLLAEIKAGKDPNNYLTNQAWGGRNNPAALEAMAHALELGHDYPAKEKIAQVWKEYGWNAQKAKAGMRSPAAIQMADWYLSQHGYDIVKAEKSVDKSQSRQRGKTVMFVKIYGGGGSAAADLLFIETSEAQKFINQFDKVFPEMNGYMEAKSALAARQGYILTKYGRKLRVDKDHTYRSVNYEIQGTSADLMKRSIIRTDRLFKESGLDAHVLMTIHDEMIAEIRIGHDKPSLLRKVSAIMRDSEGAIGIPMDVEAKRMTETWESKEPLEL